MWWDRPVILEPGRQRKEDCHKFEANSVCIVSSKSTRLIQ